MPRTDPTRWLIPYAPRPAAELRLVCFPYAGGTSALYRPWSEVLPATVEVWGVEPPGRGARLGESPVDQLRVAVGAVSQELERSPGAPYVLCGYSLGSLLAFEVARELRRRGMSQVAGLIACSFPAPHLAPRLPAADVPDSEYRKPCRDGWIGSE